MERVLVINPNSSQTVTDGMDRALDALRSDDGPKIECATLAEGPPRIETDRHVEDVVAPLCRLVERESGRTAAFVDACFSDPGLTDMRRTASKPVFGIAESGILTALSLGKRFGVISILESSVPRHLCYIRSLGLESRLAGDLPVGLGFAELCHEQETVGRMLDAGRRLIEEMGADVLITGCAGMAPYRDRLEEDLDVPIVDPVQAAVGMAVTAVRLGYRPAKAA